MILEKVPGMPRERQYTTFIVFGLGESNHLALHIHIMTAQAE